MGVARPGGPYALEMTAGAAWPNADEDAYFARSQQLGATLAALVSARDVWERNRATLFGGAVWSGDAADAAAAEVARRSDAIQTLGEQLRIAITAADAAGSVIGDTKQDVTTNVSLAQRLIAEAAAFADNGELGAIVNQIVLATYSANTALVASAAARLAVPPVARVSAWAHRPQSPAKRDDIPSPQSDPESVKQWWDNKTRDEQERLLGEHPDELGNLKGISCADRDTANRTVMERDMARVESAASDHHVSVDDVKADPGKYGLSPTDVDRYANAVEVKKGLDKDIEGKPRKYLLAYDPEAFHGEGRAAIAYNNPDESKDIAVVVPGTTSSVKAGFLDHDDGKNLYTEMRAASGTAAPCVVMWMGYDAPETLLPSLARADTSKLPPGLASLTPVDPEWRVATPTLAREGGALLAGDVNALRVTHDDLRFGDPHLTVIGHSYGSTTVADAAAGFGMRADDVVLIGSPGTDLARSAADFHLPENGHVYVGSASTDPVTHLGDTEIRMPFTDNQLGLGADPAVDGFGSTRFHAEVPGFNPKFWEEHSQYYVPGSESLYGIADIAAGNGAALQDHGMTAPHRSALPGIGDYLPDPETIHRSVPGRFHPTEPG